MKWIGTDKKTFGEWFALRGDFEFDGGNAVIRTSAAAEYAVFINGKRIFCGLVKAFDFHRYYDETEITDYLIPGKNIICILSLGGEAAAEVVCGGKTVFETDESWKIESCAAIEPKTAQLCAPLEPQKRFEEHYDASKNNDITSPEFDYSGADYAKVLFEAAATENFGGKPSGNTVYAKETVSVLGAGLPNGFGFRLFNNERKENPVSKMCMEVYGISVTAEHDFTAKVKCMEASFFVNGSMVSDTVSFNKGENFILAVNSGYAPEMFIYGAGLKISDCAVQSFETSKKCFAWTYPYSPFEGTDTERKIFEIKRAVSFSEFMKIAESPGSAEIRPISARFCARLTEFSNIDGGYSLPELNLPVKGSSGAAVCGAQNMLFQNETRTSVSGGVNFVLDFGAEVFGFVTLSLKGEKGAKLIFEPFELVGKNGADLHGRASFSYTCGGKIENYTSFYARGFRFLSVTVLGGVSIKFIGVQEACSASGGGYFRCDDEAVNEIYDMSVRTAKLCMADTYIDCPGYEQVYWFGDAKVTQEVNLSNFGRYEYDFRCLELIGQSITDEYVKCYKKDDKRFLNGEFLTIPALGTYCDGGLPEWSLWYVASVYDYYMYSGRDDRLEELMPYVEKLLENCKNMMSGRGLYSQNGAWHLIEWASNDLLPCGEVTVCSCYLYHALLCAEKLEKAVGGALAAEYALRAENLKSAINKYCFDEKLGGFVDTVRDEYGYGIYCDFFKANGLETVPFEKFKKYTRVSEQTNAAAIFCGAADEKHIKAAYDAVSGIKNPDYVIKSGTPLNKFRNPEDESVHVRIGSPFYLYFTFGAMMKMGDHAAALDCMKRFYGIISANGYDTCFESFGAPDGINLTRSICHGWGASPAVYLITEIAGVKPLDPGFRRVLFEPHTGFLKKLKAHIPTPLGTVFVNIDEEKGIKEITCPGGMETVRS